MEEICSDDISDYYRALISSNGGPIIRHNITPTKRITVSYVPNTEFFAHGEDGGNQPVIYILGVKDHPGLGFDQDIVHLEVGDKWILSKGLGSCILVRGSTTLVIGSPEELQKYFVDLVAQHSKDKLEITKEVYELIEKNPNLAPIVKSLEGLLPKRI